MERGRASHEGARRVVAAGHVVVGLALLGFASVLVYAGSRPNAELEGVLGPLGALLGLVAVVFITAAVRAWREARRGRSSTSVTLSIVELVVGLGMAVAVGNAVSGYLAFERWRSPLMPPTLVLVALGLAGLVAEGRLGRRVSPG